MTTAKRNNQIKTVLEKQFGKGKVWVRGSRGTAYGWVNVYVDADPDKHSRNEVMTLINSAKIEIDTYGYDDPGSDYGYGNKINVSFRVPYDVTEKREKAEQRATQRATADRIDGYDRDDLGESPDH